MSLESRHVTLSQVAAAAGVTVATASYALRNSPKISAKTSVRVTDAARLLGYRPDPRISSLMMHIRRARPLAHGEHIAFIWVRAKPGVRTHPLTFKGARERALQLGFGLTEFWLSEPDLTPVRLSCILKSRGIAGIVLSPLHDRIHFRLNMDWSQFTAVVIGNASCTPGLHHAGHHHFAGMRLALEKAREARPRRISAAFEHVINERAGRAWSAAFIEYHPFPASARKYLMIVKDPASREVKQWVGRLSPCTLITTLSLLRRLRIAGLNLPKDVQVILLDWHPNPQGYPGVDVCEDLIAANAIDMVVAQLQRNERGVPEHVKILHLPGTWRPAGNRPPDPAPSAPLILSESSGMPAGRTPSPAENIA